MTSISTLGQALDQIERLGGLQGQAALLQTQMTTGKKATLFAGLGSNSAIIESQRARADFKKLDTYIININVADRRMNVMTNSLGELKTQAGNVLQAITIQPQQGGNYDVRTVGDLADNVYDFVVNLINSKDGDRFLFGGAETLTQPLTDTGALDTYMQSKLDAWVNGTLDTDSLIQSYRSRTQLDDTTIGYSAPLASGDSRDVVVRVDDQTDLDYTVRANGDALRDVLTAIGMIRNLNSSIDKVALESGDPVGTRTAPGASKSEQNDNFYQLFNDLGKMLTSALDRMDQESSRVAQTQAQMKQIGDNHKIEKNTLLSTIGTVEDADMNEVAVKLNSLQVQLEAAYRVTALVSQLSLVNFLE